MNLQRAALAFLLAGSACLAQSTAPPTADKVFDFANKPSPQCLQEIATILRTVGDIQHLAIDSDAPAVTVNGNTDQLEMSGWIIHQLDRPAQAVAAVTEPYLVPPTMDPHMPNAGDDVIRVFFLQHTATPQGIQQLLTVLRTVADVQKVFNYNATKALVLRGPSAQVALAAYLVNALDVESGAVKTASPYQYQPAALRGRQEPATVARVYYLANSKTPQQTQELLTVLRTVADIQKIFNATEPNALAIRGTAADLAVSEWIIQSLDIPPAAKPAPGAVPREFVIPANAAAGNLVHVFYPAYISKAQQIQQTMTLIRTQESVQKIFCYTALPALVVRGTPDQITKSEQIILAQDRLAQTNP